MHMTAARNDDDYRPGVGIILLNSEHQVFVAQRIDSPGPAWQMPQGGIDPGERPQEAALRELEEETGTALAEMLHEIPGWFYYELPEEMCQSLWGGRFRGQRQRWFILRFTGTDADIDIATAHPEFSVWRWADPATLPDLIVPFKRDLYRELVARLQEFLKGGQ